VALGGRYAPTGPLRLTPTRGQGKPPAPAPAIQRKPFEEYGNSTATVLMCLRDLKDGLRRGSRGQQAGKGGKNAPLR